MAFYPPAGNAVDFTASGYNPNDSLIVRFQSGWYVAPAGDAVVAVLPSYVYPIGSAADFSLPPPDIPTGNGAVTVAVIVEGHGTTADLTVEGDGSVTVAIVASGTGAHGVAGQGATEISMSASGSGTVERYELRGEVRLSGILVNRRVRAYRRDTGEMVGEGDTVAGKFKIHTGFVTREHYIIPVDMASDATDWLPPCANRVQSVLAQDTA